MTYKDNVMAEYIDPIKTLGLASQFKTPLPDNKALQDLQTKGALANLQNRSLEARTRQQGINTLRNTALTQGINMPETGVLGQPGMSKLEEERLANLFGKHATGTSLLRRAGMTPQLPKSGALPSEMPQQRYKVGAFPLAAAEAVKARVRAEKGSSLKQKYFDFDDKGRFSEWTKEEYFKRKAEKKGGSPALIAEAQKLMEDANLAYPGQDIQVNKDPSTGALVLTVNGVQKERDI